MVAPKNFETIELVIDSSNANVRLDKALLAHPKITSRSRAAQLIAGGQVSLEGQNIKSSHITEVGETFTINFPLETSVNLKPWAFKLDIVFEDDQLIVVNKPAGLVVHPSHGHDDKTLVNALVYHCRDLSMGFAENRPGIVHRLDKDTSGLIVVAKNDRAHQFLAQQFKDKTADRSYYALCYGNIQQEGGRIESHLIRHPVHRKKFCSAKSENDKGKWAATNWKLLEQYQNEISLLSCRLETGRTHQIRIHLSEMGHPIIGDKVYGRPNKEKSLKSVKLRKKIAELKRIGLVAVELGFRHPTNKMHMSFRCHWPEDLLDIVDSLGFN